MKKGLLCLIIILILEELGIAQTTADDKKGQSSIVFKSSNINFDLGEAALSASWNNYRKLSLINPHTFLWGLSTNAKNKDGLAELFNNGKLTTQSKIGGFLGVRINGTKKDLDLQNQIRTIEKRPAIIDYRNVLDYHKSMAKLIVFANASNKKELKDTLNAILKKFKGIDDDILKLSSIVAGYTAAHKYTMATALQVVVDSLQLRKANADSLKRIFIESTDQITSLNEQLTDYRDSHKSQAWTIYVNGGWNANKFNFFDDAVSTSLSEKFDTVKFRGGFVDIGVNFDYGPRWTFGLSVGYERYNNLDSFDTKDFTLRNSTTQGSQSLTSETKYSAYSGAYVAYGRFNIKTDMLYFAKVNDDYRIVWDVLYTRLLSPVNEGRIRSIWNAGTSINLYKSKGKLVGGLYVQSTDVFNHMDSKDNFGERIGFGVVVKYSFVSIADRLGLL